MILTAQEVMTKDVVVLHENDSVNFFRFTMDFIHSRHVPVVNEDHELVGILTHRDLLEVNVSKFSDVSEKEQAELNA